MNQEIPFKWDFIDQKQISFKLIIRIKNNFFNKKT